VKVIGVLARPDLAEAGPTVRDLVEWLGKRGVRPCLDAATAALGQVETTAGCSVVSGRQVAAEADALVVLGDGAVAASRLLSGRCLCWASTSAAWA
jgi:hypothetical protein